MSEYTAIRGASRTLLALLQNHITNSTDPQLQNVRIDLRSPREMRVAQDNGVSVWLYRVLRNSSVLNLPVERRSPNQIPRRSLPMDLYYLVTPLAAIPDDEQLLLGRVLQIFNDHPVLRGADLADSLAGEPVELRLTLETLTLEELTRVWGAMQESYQLSITYALQLVSIDSDHEPVRAEPVLVKTTEYAEIVGST